MQTLTPELQMLLTQLSQHLQSEPNKNPSLLEIWDAWVADLDLPPQTKSLALLPLSNYERERKSTKTGSVRFLKINVELGKLLEQIKPARVKPDELVFTNPTRTNHIDSHNFRNRWIKVLKKAGIPYRRPHIIRHSFASHAIEQGIPLTGVAYLLGHSDTRMVAQTYGHLINRPSLPNIL
jgi:integrase